MSDHRLSPLACYRRELQRPDFIADPAQTEVVTKLEQRYQALAQPARSGATCRGLYIWGPVGRGKSYLMDSFYASLPTGLGLRLHFHRFMRRVHRRLLALSGRSDPLRTVGAEIAAEARVLCFDEFFVADIGDATILARLLQTLFDHGVMLIATSNVAPAELYRDGLQRQRFLPAIALLESQTEVVALDGGQDYRRLSAASLPFYLTPDDAAAEQQLRALVSQRARGPLTGRGRVEILGRRIDIRAQAENLLWFEFAALCEGPRSQLDYIELAERYELLVVSGVPQLGGRLQQRKVAVGTEDSLDNSIGGIDRSVQQGWHDDAARRLIALVDELYDNGRLLLLSAAVPVDQLYAGGRVAFEFQRTISRLIEMQTRHFADTDRTRE
ncbi:cell division protein ZapE [Motiliproteus sediminis]|uniref:cell division protein ZapE n=1 Tax=Motiliproteus sediminis TaxID=1468178 RepID=UPI001FECDA4C|nr:cell division protein ZapE [Motiliproteus sediminis]